MSETPCPICGQIHGTACNATIPANPTDQIAAVPAYDWGYDDSDGTDETCFVLGRKTDRGFEILAQVYGDGGKHLAAYIERLEATDDEVDGFYCLAAGHVHRNRYAEALCSARYQIAQLRAERDALLAERTLVDIVFDGPPSHESGRFVEVEDMSGAGVRVGEWIDRGNGYWALRISATTPRG